MMINQTTRMSAFFSIMVLAGACSQAPSSGGTVSQLASGQTYGYMKVDINQHPLDKTICDPFTNLPSDNLDQGIRGTLYTSVPGGVRLNGAENYVLNGVKSAQSLFFSDINVPTRMFSSGFSNQTNDYLKDDNQQKLIEYFGIKFETRVRLAEVDSEGTYEFAVLSDDGAILKMNQSGAEVALVQNDGDHPTKMGCSTQVVQMNRETKLPLSLSYYQGPRYHIANVLMWRKVDVAGKDPLCKASGNSLFFDPNHSSAPLKAYSDLLARGWKVLTSQQFLLPQSESYNPCVEGAPPVISGFRVVEIFSSGVILAWQTDVPSSSQVKIVNKATGTVILTDSDNALRKDHLVQLMGLESGVSYTAQAVSIGEDLGHALSESFEFTTP